MRDLVVADVGDDLTFARAAERGRERSVRRYLGVEVRFQRFERECILEDVNRLGKVQRQAARARSRCVVVVAACGESERAAEQPGEAHELTSASFRLQAPDRLR